MWNFMPMQRGRACAAAAFALNVALAGWAFGQTHVHPVGFFDPSGLSNEPFQLVAAGICAAPEGGEVLLAPGDYHEAFATNKPAVLTSSVPVRIGVATSSSTVLTALSYNTHLFGDEGYGTPPTWLDDERAPYIVEVCGDAAVDVLGVQELWDPEYYDIFAQDSGYASGFHGDGIEIPGVLNSGLGLFSKYALVNPLQTYYDDENQLNEDSLASKGFIQADITKDGFTIGVFNTHTQAQNDLVSKSVRELQIEQLADAIFLYRAIHPNNLVIVMGDFNVPGETDEYVDAMRDALWGTAGGLDTARNTPCSADALSCTSCADNELNDYFNDGEVTETRLDYFIYFDSLLGTEKIRPLYFEVRDLEIPPQYPELSDDGLTTRDLSDHYAVYAEFHLYRP